MVGKNILEHTKSVDFNFIAPSRKELNLCNFNETLDYVNRINPDLIIHAAGIVGGIQANINKPISFLLDNLQIGNNIALAAYKANVKKLINLGSSCMYPKDFSGQLSEEMILGGHLEPTNEGYALAKIVTARLCDYIRIENKYFLYKTIIPCNLYGRFDKFNPEQSHLIPAIINKLHQAKMNCDSYVSIWGDGNARREFMYAGDFAECLLNLVENFERIPSYLNIGLGHDFSIKEYYEVAAKVIGYKGRFKYDLSKPVGMNKKLVNINKQLSLGWKSTTKLADGIEKTYKYYLESEIK